MNLSQLETERSNYTQLVERMKKLQALVTAVQAGDHLDAAHQALQIVRTPKGSLAVQTLVALLIQEEAAALGVEGADFDHYAYFPEVVFSGVSKRDRDTGAKDQVFVSPGAEGSIAAALKHMGSVGGEYAFDDKGGLMFTVSRKELSLPEVVHIPQDRPGYTLAGDGKGVEQ